MDWTVPFLWIFNGMLAAAYVMFDHLLAVVLVPSLFLIYHMLPVYVGEIYTPVMRPAVLACSLFALATSLAAPSPAPEFLVVMVFAGVIAIRLEKFRPDEIFWQFIQGMILYSLVGLGIALFQVYLRSAPADPDNLLSMGRNYVGVLAAVALWGMPVANGAMLVKGLLVHAPVPGGSPERLIDTIRTRNDR